MNKSKSSFIRSSISPIFIFFILCIIRNVDNYAQSDSTHQKKWSIGIYGGALVPSYDFTNYYNSSPFLGIKAEYNFKPYLSVYLRSTYNFLKSSTMWLGVFVVRNEFGKCRIPACLLQAGLRGNKVHRVYRV
jgi:hypothetical protein